MNIFKRLNEAIFGRRNRKKVNLNVINQEPVVGLSNNASRGRFGWSFHSNGVLHGRGKRAWFDRVSNRWREGGTESYLKAHAGRWSKL